MTCKKCGKINRKNNNYCTGCGVSLADVREYAGDNFIDKVKNYIVSEVRPFKPYVAFLYNILLSPAIGCNISFLSKYRTGHKVKAIFSLLAGFLSIIVLIKVIKNFDYYSYGKNSILKYNITLSIFLLIDDISAYQSWRKKNKNIKALSGFKAVPIVVLNVLFLIILLFVFVSIFT